MAIFKCKMCGGALEINNETVAVCQYCGTKQTLPKLDDDRKANLYDRANHFRRNNEFDKAMGIYEQILNEDNTDAESYWSLVLCRYGIEYVEDPTSHKRIPTINRSQFTSVFDDEDYKSAIKYADGSQKEIYESEANAINEIHKKILAISSQEEPFDVFICYKESDNSGRRTPDSVLATELYHELVREGFKVFFSRITLEDKLGQEYEPYIFAALNSAKVMVVLGTKPEYFNAVWVKNEWSRYLALIKNGERKILIPAYKEMDPYDLPEEFSHLQAQDMSKLGFMQDLIRGIKKVNNATEASHIEAKTPTDNTNNISAILDRAFIHLETKEWTKANRLFEEALKINPRLSDAYLGKCMVDLYIENRELIIKKGKSTLNNKNFKLAFRFAGEQQKKDLQKIVTEIQNNIKQQKAKSKKRFKIVAKICLIVVICISLAFGGYTGYINLIYFPNKYNEAKGYIAKQEYDKAIECLKECENYKDSTLMYNYYNGLKLYNKQDFENAIPYFAKSKSYKDGEVKCLYSKAFFEFEEKNYYDALGNFNLIPKDESIENLKEYNFCKGVYSSNISDAKHYFSLCGDYELAKKALENLSIVEKIQGSWKGQDSGYGVWYSNITITDMGGVYSARTETEKGTISLRVDDRDGIYIFFKNPNDEDSVGINMIEFVNVNKIKLGMLEEKDIFVRIS